MTQQLLAELAAAEAALAPGASAAAHHALRYRLMLSTHAPRLRPSEWVGGRAYSAERLSAAGLEPAAGCLRSLLSLEMHGAVLQVCAATRMHSSHAFMHTCTAHAHAHAHVCEPENARRRGAQLLPSLVLLGTTHDLEPLLVELLGRYLGAASAAAPSLARRHSGSGRALVADVATPATPAASASTVAAAAASAPPPSSRRQLARAGELQGLISASLCVGGDTGDTGAEAAEAAEAAAGLWCGVLARAALTREWAEAPLRLLADAIVHGLVTRRLPDAPSQLRACVHAINAHAAATGDAPPAPLALLRAGMSWLAYAVALTIEPQLPPLRLAPPTAAAAAAAAAVTPQRRHLISRAFTFTSRRLSSSPADADADTPPPRHRSFSSRVVRSASFGRSKSRSPASAASTPSLQPSSSHASLAPTSPSLRPSSSSAYFATDGSPSCGGPGSLSGGGGAARPQRGSFGEGGVPPESSPQLAGDDDSGDDDDGDGVDGDGDDDLEDLDETSTGLGGAEVRRRKRGSRVPPKGYRHRDFRSQRVSVGVWASLAAGAPSVTLALLCWEEWARLCEQALRTHYPNPHPNLHPNPHLTLNPNP